jgi:hypothetical protein
VLGALILAGVGVALVAWLVHQARSGAARATAPACPASRGPVALLVPVVEDLPRRSYEVCGCGTCRTAIATVHGVPSRWAYCPACFQRTLQVDWAVVPEPGDLEVSVDERCHLCGHEDGVTMWLPVDDDASLREDARLGRVIPFPSRRLRAGDG